MTAAPLQSRDHLRTLLKGLRRRVDPATTTLGEHERLSCRRGRSVSQEELADRWRQPRLVCHARTGRTRSAVDLDARRLARALGATREERWALFQLAIPELQELS